MKGTPGAVSSAFLFALMVLAWAGNYLFVRLGLASTGALWLGVDRAGLGAAAVAVYLLAGRGAPNLSRRDVRDALLLGVPNTAAFFGLWFSAARSVPAGQAAVIIYTFPIFVALLSMPILGRTLGPNHWIAVGAGFVGVTLVAQPWSGGSAGVGPAGLLELVGAAVCWAAATVLFQRRFPAAQLATANGFQLVGGTAALVLAAAVLEPGGPGPVSVPLVVAVLWLGLYGTAFGYIVWFWLLERHPASTLSAYVFLVPLTALGLGGVFQGERVDLAQALGAALVVVSVYLVARAGRIAPSPVAGPLRDRP